jgi:hypothetical protein
MQRFDLYLANVQIKKLKSIAKKTGYSAAELVRKAVDEWLEKYEEKGRK